MMHQPGPMGMHRPQGPRGYGPVSTAFKRHALRTLYRSTVQNPSFNLVGISF